MSEWVPVSEKLPENEQRVLATAKGMLGRRIDILLFVEDLHKFDEYSFDDSRYGFLGSDPEWGDYEVDDVLAWMPLPKAYEGE